MSRRDGEADSELEALLATSEKMEAEALRAELQAFLRSPEARRELQEIVLKPVESAITAAMQSIAMQERIKQQVLDALTPQLAAIAKSAVTSAVRDAQVTLDDKVKDALRTRAEKVLRDAFEEAETQAFNSLPRLVEGTRKHVKGELERAARDAAAELREGNQSRDDRTIVPRVEWKRRLPSASLMLISVVIIVGVLYWLVKQPSESVIENPPPYDAAATSNTTTQSSDPATAQATPSALYTFYSEALSRAQPKGLPDVTKEQKQCLESGIRAWELGGSNADLAELKSSLGACTATKGKPTGASRIIAAVQEQLDEEAAKKTCSTLQRVAVDGLAGKSTQDALQSYIGCTAPLGLTSNLDTLADYATVGIYFVYKRDIKHE